MNSIAIPQRQILLPRFEFPRWLRHLKDEKSERVSRMFRGAMSDGGVFAQPMGGAGVATVNPLAAVPWVAQWKFNNNGNDSIGSNNLTNNNSATFTTGKLGGATGATQLTAASTRYWSIPDNAAVSMGTGVKWLISLWFYADDVSGVKGLITKGDTAEYFVDMNGNSLRFYINNANVFNMVSAISATTWYNLAFWYNGTTYSASLNNAAAVTGGSGDTPDGASPLFIGNRGAGAWGGRIDNVCMAKSASTFVTQSILDLLWNNGNGTEQLT